MGQKRSCKMKTELRKIRHELWLIIIFLFCIIISLLLPAGCDGYEFTSMISIQGGLATIEKVTPKPIPIPEPEPDCDSGSCAIPAQDYQQTRGFFRSRRR